MESQWTAYSDAAAAAAAASRPVRYTPQNMTTPQHAQRDPNVPPQTKPDPYASPTGVLRTNSMGLVSPTGLRGRGPEYHDVDGDVPMEDADPCKPKFSSGSRSNHQHRHSQQFLQHDESIAARRYSPMNLSPTSPYSGNVQSGGPSYAGFSPQAPSSRQSPTKNNPYLASPNSYYSPPSRFQAQWPATKRRYTDDRHVASRPHAPQLPPIQSNMSPESFYPQSATAQLNAVYNREARSPRAANPNPPQPPPIGPGPVPKFDKCTNTADLQPKITAQPPFRRAHPEGGFISVGSTLLHLGSSADNMMTSLCKP